ncbi:hypothetical protein D3C76_1654440 [compost metagenome]
MQLGAVEAVLVDHALHESVHIGTIGEVALANPLAVKGFARWCLVDEGALWLWLDHGRWGRCAAAAIKQGEGG